MKGVSEVIAIILILMITISIAGLAYTFMSSTMASTTSAASSAVDSTASSMSTSFTIESMDVAKVYLRNTGQTALMNLSVYVNDEPTVFNITPSSIVAGQVGTVTIYSFIPDGATVKINSPNGFSASKVASPCDKSSVCWKFDETTGTIAYDSSPYGNDGTLVNGASFTQTLFRNGLLFDGVNDYAISNSFAWSNHISNAFTISFLAYPKTYLTAYAENRSRIIDNNGLGAGSNTSAYLSIYYSGSSKRFQFGARSTDTGEGIWPFPSTNSAVNLNQWYSIAWVWNYTHNMIYQDGILILTSADNRVGKALNFTGILLAKNGAEYGNITIDEVRVYNRAIY